MLLRIIIFLILNFAALAIGSLLMGEGSSSLWYSSLNTAPWTPPGWVFGAAWTTIMLCFSYYMAEVWKHSADRKRLAMEYGLQWVLNVSWNFFFFNLEHSVFGLIIISLLTVLVGFFLFKYRKTIGFKSVFILPYFIWLLIATSLNAYVVFYN